MHLGGRRVLAQSYDWQHGGWGQAPKFPQPMSLEFLLKRASRGDSLAIDMVNDALKAMSKGGMYDVVGGGFARYSVDEQWLVPHFEKMLYDNALLLKLYSQVLLSQDPSVGSETRALFTSVIAETVQLCLTSGRRLASAAIVWRHHSTSHNRQRA